METISQLDIAFNIVNTPLNSINNSNITNTTTNNSTNNNGIDNYTSSSSQYKITNIATTISKRNRLLRLVVVVISFDNFIKYNCDYILYIIIENHHTNNNYN